MAHVGQKLALDPVGGLRGNQGAFKGLTTVLSFGYQPGDGSGELTEFVARGMRTRMSRIASKIGQHLAQGNQGTLTGL